MRAVIYDRFGPAEEVLEVKEIPTPSPGAGEVLVRLHTSGVNPSDVKARAGARPGVTKPPYSVIIPHSDGAGVIEAVGEGVEHSRIGERVWVWNGQWQRAFGTAAEYICLPSAQAVSLPNGVSFEVGAALGIPGFTAAHAVFGGGSVEGKTVLVSGGAGAVGHLAVQMAAWGGAHVISTARGADKLASVKNAGAAHVLDYSADSLADQVLDANGGKPVDRIVEVEFGKNAETNTKVIVERGTIAAYGSAKDPAPTIPYYPLMFKAVTIDLLLIYILSAEERATAIAYLTRLLEAEALEFRLSEMIDFSDCARAHQLVETGGRVGPTILKIEC